MKKEKISQALGNIHTKFVEEAASYQDYGQKAWRKWGTIAASFVAVFVCLSILVVGFGPNGFFDKPSQEKEKVTFTVLVPTGSFFQGLIQSAWDNFAQQSPELQGKEVTLKFVDYEGTTSYFQKEGNTADLIFTDDYSLWALFAEDQLVDLNLLGAGQYKDRFSESVWELGTADDVLYGLPFSAGTVLYSGRKDVMDAAGVALPQTWEEMLTVGSTLKQAGQTHIFYEQCYSPRHSMGGDTNLLLSWIWRLGGDVINEDGTATAINENDALTKTLTMFRELQEQNLLVEAGSDESVFTQMYDYWVQYYLQNEENQRVYGLMPQLEEGIPGYSIKYGYCVGIPKISKQQSLTYAFLEHLVFGTDSTTGKPYQIVATEKYWGVLPSEASLLAEIDFSEDLLKIYTEQLSISKVLPRTKAFPYCAEILAGTIAEVLENGRDPAEVAAEVEQELNRLLEAYLQNGNPDPKVPKWEEMTISEQFSSVEYGNNAYSSRVTQLDVSYIGESLGSTVMTGRDQITGREHQVNATLYAVKLFPQSCVIAVQFEGQNDYYGYVNSYYRPETLGDFMEDLNLQDIVSFGSVWYSYFSPNGEYTTVEFVNVADSVVWEMLCSDTSVKNVYEDGWSGDHPTAMSVSVDIPLLGYKNISLAVTEDGYLTTNILDTGKAFYIGIDKVQAFMDYVIENCEGYEAVYENPFGGTQPESGEAEEPAVVTPAVATPMPSFTVAK